MVNRSNWKPVTSGIAQGSVLGPIVFTIVINDMPDVVYAVMKLFPDDAEIFKAIQYVSDITAIQDGINKLLQWSTLWQLPLNIGKCKCLHYGRNNPNHTRILLGRMLVLPLMSHLSLENKSTK